jgi:hypothetical protein
MSGNGISDAVRGAVKEWMTDETVDVLFEEYKKANNVPAPPAGRFAGDVKMAFKAKVRFNEDWVRVNRLNAKKGYIRTYYNKGFPKRDVTLEVKTNEMDTVIDYVSVKVKGKVVGGGKVRVPSVDMPQTGRKAKIQLEPEFTPFTAKELEAIAKKSNSSDDAIMMMFEERIF